MLLRAICALFIAHPESPRGISLAVEFEDFSDSITQ